MARKVYFDTVAFREIGRALGTAATLPADLREHLLVSPLSAFEVLSQLSITKGGEILREIQAIHNWIDPQNAGLLPWPDDVLATVGFGKCVKDDDFTRGMSTAFNVCLAASSAESLREEAGKLKNVMDRIKSKTAQDFGRLVATAKKGSPKGDWFTHAWFEGIAKRAKAEAKQKSACDLAIRFGAYHEFEHVKLRTALQAKNYNPEKHQNDLIDAEQLIYLSCPELHFLTCDGGFAGVTKSPQSARIIIVKSADISDVDKVEKVLRKIIGTANSPAFQSAT